eukprot:scaffold43229_cov17-Prasinocladus_malaysianus.AAC.1
MSKAPIWSSLSIVCDRSHGTFSNFVLIQITSTSCTRTQAQCFKRRAERRDLKRFKSLSKAREGTSTSTTQRASEGQCEHLKADTVQPEGSSSPAKLSI